MLKPIREDLIMRDNSFKKVGTILFFILAAVFVLCVGGFILLPLVTFILILIPDLIFLIILFVQLKKDRCRASFVCGLVFAGVLAFHSLFWGMFHMPVGAYTKWQYPFAYSYSYGRSTDVFLPRQLPASAKNIHFEFIPTVMQGSGWISVEFTADEAYVKDLEERFKDSKYVVKIKDLGKLNQEIDETDPTFGTITLQGEEEMAEKHPDATVYIVYSNGNFNHPRSKAVFIDGNYVKFSHQ